MDFIIFGNKGIFIWRSIDYKEQHLFQSMITGVNHANAHNHNECIIMSLLPLSNEAESVWREAGYNIEQTLSKSQVEKMYIIKISWEVKSVHPRRPRKTLEEIAFYGW